MNQCEIQSVKLKRSSKSHENVSVIVLVFIGCVYTNGVSFVTALKAMRLRIVLKTVKSGAFSKRYGFISRVNDETASIWKQYFVNHTHKLFRLSQHFSGQSKI